MLSSPRCTLAALAIVTLCAHAGAAPRTPTEIDKDAARAAVQRGDERLAAKDYEEALDAYMRADEIMGVPTTSIEVGKVSEMLGKLVDAYAAYEKAANYPYDENEPEPFTIARQTAKDLAFNLRDRIPTLEIHVKAIDRDQPLEITLDGRYVDRGTVVRLDPGSHEVAVAAEGFHTHRETIDLAEWDDRVLDVTLVPRVATLWPMAWIGYAVAGTGVLVGSITGAVSLAAAAEAKEFCDGNDCTALDQSVVDRSLLTAHISTASFVIAGVAAAVGTVAVIISLDADEEPGATPSAELQLGPAHAGVLLRF